MKLAAFFALALALAAPLSAQSVGAVASTAAKAHVGEYVHVTGPVAEVYVNGKGDTFIHFDAVFPDSDFSAVVFASDHDKFGDLSKLRGQTITVTGTIREYKDKPEIVLKRREQLGAKKD